MSQSDLLDILLGVILVLVALIGLWQGIVRSLLYLAGSLLGSELALWWSDDLGDLLADWLPLSTETGRFVAATIFIVTSMILVGSGFSSLIWRFPRDWRNRAGGFITGLGLGALTLGLILRYYFVFLQGRAEAALGDTRIASRLWSDFNWVVAAVALSLAVMIVVGWVLGPPAPDHVQAGVQSQPSDTARTSHRQVAPQSDSDQVFAAAVEARGPADSRGGAVETRFPPVDETIYAGTATNGPKPPSVLPEAEFASHTLESSSFVISSELRETPEYAPQRATATEALRFDNEDIRERREAAGICPNCGMLLRIGDAYCPDCGFPVEL